MPSYQEGIYVYPYKSEPWNRVKKFLEAKLINKREHDKLLITFKAPCDKECKSEIRELNNRHFIPINDSTKIIKDVPFVSDERIMLIPRYKAEYDTHRVQFSVACRIHDNQGNFIVLKRNPKFTDGAYTLLQGHVDYSEEFNSMTEAEFLKLNMIREINEEIKIESCGKINPVLTGFMYSTDNRVKSEHIAALFDLELPTDVLFNIVSNEPKKHTVERLNKELMTNQTITDPWVRISIRN